MKKILSVGFVLALMTTNIGTIFASDFFMTGDSVSAVTVVAAETVDQSVIQKFEKGISAGIIHEDGSKSPVDVEITIAERPATTTTEGKSYAILATSTTKVLSEATDRNNKDIFAAQTLRMVWTDMPGVKNTIDKLAGEIIVEKGTFKQGTVLWGNPYTVPTGRKIVGKSFDFATDYTSTDWILGTVGAELTSYFAETTDGFYIEVQPTIFN